MADLVSTPAWATPAWVTISGWAFAAVGFIFAGRNYWLDRHRLRITEPCLSLKHDPQRGARLAFRMVVTNHSKRVVRICEAGIEIRDKARIEKGFMIPENRIMAFKAKGPDDFISLEDGQQHTFEIDPLADFCCREFQDGEHAYAKTTQGKYYRAEFSTEARNQRIGVSGNELAKSPSPDPTGLG